jgi:hypothetical protein
MLALLFVSPSFARFLIELCGIVVSGFEAAMGSVTVHGFDFADATQIDFRFR